MEHLRFFMEFAPDAVAARIALALIAASANGDAF
jgi:hypothetical protein